MARLSAKETVSYGRFILATDWRILTFICCCDILHIQL